MGCVASRLEEEDEVVSICRERKRLIKLAVERRYALADAHCRYCQSLYAVSAAIKLFVARHSSPSSPFLITFPPPCPPSPPLPPSDHQKVITNPMFLQQTPTEANHETIECKSCGSSTSVSSSEEDDEEGEDARCEVEKQGEKEQTFGYFYMQTPPPMPSPQRDFGWDFFYPFDAMRTEVVNPYQRFQNGDEDDHLRVVREQEGIPELEEEGEEKNVVSTKEKWVSNTEKEHNENNGDEMVKVVEDRCNNVNSQIEAEQKGLTVIDNPEMGRELLDALKDIEDYFVRAYNSGKDVSRMLEANMTRLESGMEEIRENSTKLIQAITWHRTASLKPSSCKSLAASGSKSSSTWTEYSNDLFDDYGGMDSGSHSLTLGRIYAWEKKLFEEVKAGDSTRKIYEKKCVRLRNQDATKGYDDLTADKTRASVKDLYARILVAIRSAETISKRIQVLRDEELQPQIIELLKGLTQTWRVMMESHETQSKILYEVKTFSCPTHGKFCNDSHRLATLQLEAELLNWRGCFTKYVSAQRAYVEALHGWLSKFLVPEVEFYSRGRGSGLPVQASGPPLLIMCRDWLSFMEKLPQTSVAYALKSFSKDVRALWTQQGEEQQQKRRVEGLAKELNRRTVTFQKAETRLLEYKPSEERSESETENQSEYCTSEKNDTLAFLRKKLEMEREKHHNYMQETQRITLNGFQTGFSAVFESVAEFSKASLKMYIDLVAYGDNIRKAAKQSYIEGCSVEEDDNR